MNVEVVKYEGDTLIIRVRGETYTLFSPLVEYLLQDPDVEYVTYDVDHPLFETSTMKIRTKGADPLEVIRRAVQRILGDLSEIRRSLGV